MHKFDYSFLDNSLIPSNFANLTASISSLKTMAGVRKNDYANIFTELEAVAKVQSIKSSNAIEGIITSDERIAAIVNQNSAPLNHNEAEIAGYRDALQIIHILISVSAIFLIFMLRSCQLQHIATEVNISITITLSWKPLLTVHAKYAFVLLLPTKQLKLCSN